MGSFCFLAAEHTNNFKRFRIKRIWILLETLNSIFDIFSHTVCCFAYTILDTNLWTYCLCFCFFFWVNIVLARLDCFNNSIAQPCTRIFTVVKIITLWRHTAEQTMCNSTHSWANAAIFEFLKQRNIGLSCADIFQPFDNSRLKCFAVAF